jgi:hypothetical protein
MTMTFERLRLLASVLAACAIVACSPMKEPAAAALADANNALQKISPEGQKYAPAELATVTDQVSTMKAAFDREDYQTVLNMVAKVAPNLKLLAGTIANKKSEATIALKEQWAALSRDVPSAIAAAETRVAELSKARKLPKGVSKTALDGAGAAIDSAKHDWSESTSARTASQVDDAVAKGKAAHAKLAELMASLGAELPRASAK